jgi:hypothetical protein
MESAIENPVVARAERAGYFVRKVGWVGRKSAPDRVFSRADRGTVWIEFKDKDEVPTRLQTREHERMREAGMEVHVCDNIADALRVLWLVSD